MFVTEVDVAEFGHLLVTCNPTETASSESVIHFLLSRLSVKGLTADAPPPCHQNAIRMSSVGVQQGVRLMISEGLKGGTWRASG